MELESEEENSEDEYMPGEFCVFLVPQIIGALNHMMLINGRSSDKEAESSEESESDVASSEEEEPSVNSDSEEPTPKKVFTFF